MLKFKVVAVQRIVSKDGKTYYKPTIVLSDGDVWQLFTSKVVNVGDEISCSLTKMTSESGAQFLQLRIV